MFAVVKSVSYSQDGGHGYGVYTTTYQEFVPFSSEKELLEWLDRHKHLAKSDYKIIDYQPVVIETTVKVVKPPVTGGCNCGHMMCPICGR